MKSLVQFLIESQDIDKIEIINKITDIFIKVERKCDIRTNDFQDFVYAILEYLIDKDENNNRTLSLATEHALNYIYYNVISKL